MSTINGAVEKIVGFLDHGETCVDTNADGTYTFSDDYDEETMFTVTADRVIAACKNWAGKTLSENDPCMTERFKNVATDILAERWEEVAEALAWHANNGVGSYILDTLEDMHE
ncbi:hypothetical protein [Corynebacterium variabile]|uniref:hypothetical protein n=1 Tax=Corynebacterium variabile TaxID=1727 RepID=UPI003BB18845